jgi:hypothetical protein
VGRRGAIGFLTNHQRHRFTISEPPDSVTLNELDRPNTGRSSRQLTLATKGPVTVRQQLILGGGESTNVQVFLEPTAAGAI